MRLLFATTHPHLPDIRGGLQTTLHDLCLTLREVGAEAAVVCGRSARAGGRLSEKAWQIDESLGYPVVRTDAPEPFVEAVASGWNASAVVALSGPRFMRLLVSCLDSGRPTVAYLHNVEGHALEGHLVPDPEVLFLANSRFAASHWAAYAGIHCRVVPPIVRGDAVIAGASGDRVLFVNPAPVKGVELMFALAAACPEIPFTVIENWELNASWRAYCQRRAKAMGNVEWLEPVDDMRPVYAQSRMLLMPSVWEEAFGRTVIEAQLNGLPVLASDRGALPDVVGAGGETISPHAPLEEWVRALRAMYESPARWSDAARSNAFAHAVSAPAIAADFLTLVAEHGLRCAPQSPAGREASRQDARATPGDLRWRLARLAPANGRTASELADDWRALADLYVSQRRLQDAEEAARHAVALAEDDARSWSQLGGILAARPQPTAAMLVLQRARTLGPDDPDAALALARMQALEGDAAASLATLDAVDALRPGWTKAIALRAFVLAEGGRDAEGSTEAAWRLLRRALRAEPDSTEAMALALRLVGLGALSPRSLPRPRSNEARLHAWRAASASALHGHGDAEFRTVAFAGASAFPDDGWLATAALHADARSCAEGREALGREAREWARSRQVRCGAPAVSAPIPVAEAARPRIAYVVEPAQREFARRVVAAHLPEAAEVFVFTNAALEDLPAGVRVLPLVPERLEADCARHGIDVAIACGGLHPFDDHYRVLEAFARRVAPVQAGWLGLHQPSGGLFDVLVTDEVVLPAAEDAECTERVLRLAGGQWCWDPPSAAPPAAPLPAMASGTVMFGVVAKGSRLDDRSLQSFARVVACVPASQARFIGRIAEDFPLQRRVRAIFARHGVDGQRLRFDPWRDLGSFRHWLGDVDLVLDPFTATGGRSLLEALWMGVPVVSLRGEWMGGRQFASVLSAIGAEEWIARDPGDFERRAIAAASDLPGLARTRAGLRDRISGSGLLDGRRVASQIEGLARELAPHASTMRACSDPIERERVRAAWELEAWLSRPTSRLSLQSEAGKGTPDLSVILVCQEEAGLVRRTLEALADQRGPSFETLVVDDAATGRGPQLLDRLVGARVLRNPERLGFPRSVNRAAAVARGRHLLLLDSAAVLEPGTLAAIARVLDGDSKIGAVGGRLVSVEGRLREAGCRVLPDGATEPLGRGEEAFGAAASQPLPADYCSSVLLATRRRLWTRLGGFDPAFASGRYEDAEYCLRIWQAGLRVAYEPDAIARCFDATGSGPAASGKPSGEGGTRFLERHGRWLRARGRPPATRSRKREAR